jgi:hypothetical protein
MEYCPCNMPRTKFLSMLIFLRGRPRITLFCVIVLQSLSEMELG